MHWDGTVGPGTVLALVNLVAMLAFFVKEWGAFKSTIESALRRDAERIAEAIEALKALEKRVHDHERDDSDIFRDIRDRISDLREALARSFGTGFGKEPRTDG